VVLGLPSSGPHANGFSLIRRILRVSGADLDADLDGLPLVDRLMAPTQIYVKSLLALIGAVPVHGLAHITGGGLVDNIPRVLPDGLEVILQRKAWRRQPIFDWLQRAGNVADAEMFRVFNCGIGMTVQVAARDADRAIAVLREAGQEALVIGEVKDGTRGVVIV
jgi:phosphoribosylformylglycinamidine cyclo-ligase